MRDICTGGIGHQMIKPCNKQGDVWCVECPGELIIKEEEQPITEEKLEEQKEITP